ncbi:MAG: basic amino acid/polyamine antiporter, family [Gaiellales bacterium]|jgi:amino acid transporter|nr:basic amino acid/polyamine antiporter, family [Gaiellales bacterium]
MAAADVPAESTLFVRKATGLVKGWSVVDAFIYSAFAINLMALGFGYAFTTIAFIPKGAIIAGVILSALFIIFETLVYASLIAVMPRAGGDYVWQSRVLHGSIGFIFAATGWWFILWHWVPIYANILVLEVIQPIMVITGNTGTGIGQSDWWTYLPPGNTHGTGIFVASLITAGFATVVVAVGMRAYAQFQKICFYGGMLGLVIILLVFAFHTKSDFISAYDRSAQDLYGLGPNAFQQLQQASDKAGTSSYPGFSSFPVKETFLLIPFLVFYNLWPNWGATLYGEVKGASDFRRNIYAMAGALIFTTVVVVITFAAMAHAMGFETYGIMSSAFWGYFVSPLAAFPYPGTLAAYFFSNALVQLIIILLLSLWFFGWAGSVFLSSTRMIFAAAFDRILPERVAQVHGPSGVPIVALALMVLPSIPISYFYAYNTTFYKSTLDATLVIAATFAVTTLSAILLPWRRPDIYNQSPIAKYRPLGIPLITLSGVVFLGFLLFCLYKWLFDGAYFVNNSTSLKYMAGLYVLAAAVYVASRVMRKREGIDLDRINSEIPVE